MQNHKTMIAAIALTILGFAFCSMGFAQDEKEFIPGEDSGFYYTIKKGDTLWDLSQKFYNSQWDWPGLWEINDDIKNPHWIYPGKKIQIFLKEKAALKPKIVPVQKVKKKIVPVKVVTSFSYSQMDQVGFIKKEKHVSLGTVIREEEGNLIMSADDIIYIKSSGIGTLVPGKIYHVFTTEKTRDNIHGKPFNGIKHLINATVRIIDHKVNYATGRITKVYRPVRKGDLIMEYYKRDSILTVEETPKPIDARMICSEDNNAMINDYRIAFIDIGKDKVKPGQIYSIRRINAVKDYSFWKPHKETQGMNMENLDSGKLIVLHTEDIASTVMVLSSKYAIHPDDIIN